MRKPDAVNAVSPLNDWQLFWKMPMLSAPLERIVDW
jgi:hypothetical protein